MFRSQCIQIFCNSWVTWGQVGSIKKAAVPNSYIHLQDPFYIASLTLIHLQVSGINVFIYFAEEQLGCSADVWLSKRWVLEDRERIAYGRLSTWKMCANMLSSLQARVEHVGCLTIYWKGWGHEPTPDLCRVRYFTFVRLVRFSCFCPRVCLQGSWNMQVWRNMPWFLQPLWVSSNSWPLPCNAQGRAEAHLGPVVLVKLRLHEDVCGCFWNEICVWICLKERVNMLNCSP